jgi:hypothetical protein
LEGAKGGAGAASSLTKGVSGATRGGALSITQTANGGWGGESFGGTGGTGGAATSALTLDDTKNSTKSASLTGMITALGGAGGAGQSGANGGAGGKATASAILTATGTLNANAVARGGQGGDASGGGLMGAGGAASASTTAHGGGSVQAQSTAMGGTGGSIAGAASATTVATGTSGSMSAAASTSLAPGRLIESVAASAGGVVHGTSTDTATATIGAASQTFVKTGQAVALVDGAPAAASTTAILNANAKIKSAFGASPVFFATGELGGGFANGGGGSQTTTSEIDMTVDLSKVSTAKHLIIGLYDGATTGTGVTSVTLDIFAGGSVDHLALGGGAAAKGAFTDKAIDLGAISALGSSFLSLRFVLTVVSDSASSGFYGGIIVGDPPASSAHARFIQGLAAFGTQGWADIVATRATEPGERGPIAAPRLAQWA